jgi:vancomycin resistance protein YoaR
MLNTKKSQFITMFVLTIILVSGCSSYNGLNNNVKNITNFNTPDNLGTVANNATSIQEVFSDTTFAMLELYPNRSNLVIAEFSTEFDSPASGRGKNIIRGSIGVDQAKIMPGEVFSFNETVGPTTEANGFHLAKIFVDGEDSEGFGGGICQVSSTLYNAVLKAKLEVVERHEHSKDVFYVEEGKDAATSYGRVDFKFKNTLKYPIKVNSYILDNKITIALEYV